MPNDTGDIIASRPRPPLRAGNEIRPIIPTTIEEAFRLAQAVVAAGLAPDSYNVGGNGVDKDEPDPQKILIGILKSCEVGLPPITGLSTIAIVRKRPVIWGDGAVALVQNAGLVDRVEQAYEGEEASGSEGTASTDFGDAFSAVFRIWRKGQATPYEGRFSVRDAKRAHLWNNTRKPIWAEYPKRMLMARARAFALREGFADALSGLSIREEVEDLPAEAPARTDVSFLDDMPQLNAPTIDGGEATAQEWLAARSDGHEQHQPFPTADRPAEKSSPDEPDAPTSGAPPAANTRRINTDDMNDRVLRGLAEEEFSCATTETPATGSDQPIIGKEQNTEVGTLDRSPTERPSRESSPQPIEPVMGGIGPRRKFDAEATLKRLVTAFYELTTVAECGAFRVRNRATVNMLPADEREAFAIDAGDHERGLREERES
jgi:hypothetical protein